jgi:hypothetical protein
MNVTIHTMCQNHELKLQKSRLQNSNCVQIRNEFRDSAARLHPQQHKILHNSKHRDMCTVTMQRTEEHKDKYLTE